MFGLPVQRRQPHGILLRTAAGEWFVWKYDALWFDTPDAIPIRMSFPAALKTSTNLVIATDGDDCHHPLFMRVGGVASPPYSDSLDAFELNSILAASHEQTDGASSAGVTATATAVVAPQYTRTDWDGRIPRMKPHKFVVWRGAKMVLIDSLHQLPLHYIEHDRIVPGQLASYESELLLPAWFCPACAVQRNNPTDAQARACASDIDECGFRMFASVTTWSPPVPLAQLAATTSATASAIASARVTTAVAGVVPAAPRCIAPRHEVVVVAIGGDDTTAVLRGLAYLTAGATKWTALPLPSGVNDSDSTLDDDDAPNSQWRLDGGIDERLYLLCVHRTDRTNSVRTRADSQPHPRAHRFRLRLWEYVVDMSGAGVLSDGAWVERSGHLAGSDQPHIEAVVAV